VRAGIRFLPAHVEAVSRLEFDPVRHRSTDEAPSAGLVSGFDLAKATRAIVSPSVSVGPAFRYLTVGAEISGGCRRVGFANADGGDKQWSGAFHDIDHLVLDRDFDSDIGGVAREGGRAVIGLIPGDGTPAPGRAGGSAGDEAQTKSGGEKKEDRFHSVLSILNDCYIKGKEASGGKLFSVEEPALWEQKGIPCRCYRRLACSQESTRSLWKRTNRER